MGESYGESPLWGVGVAEGEVECPCGYKSSLNQSYRVLWNWVTLHSCPSLIQGAEIV